MKRFLLLLTVSLFACLIAEAQRYVVNGKDGKIRVVEYHLVSGEWKYVEGAPDIYIDNGYEFEAVAPVSKDKIVMEYNGKHYHVVNPEKELEIVDDMGSGEGLGFRNALRHSFVGRWYMTGQPAMIAGVFVLIAIVSLLILLFRNNPGPAAVRAFPVAMSFVALIEAGAALSVGQDAYWWVNPDDVGYLMAICTLIPFSVTVALQLKAIKIYKETGKFSGAANVAVYLLLGLGCILSVIAAVQVVINFLFALFCLLFLLWLSGQKTYSRDSSGNIYETGFTGTHKVDKEVYEDYLKNKNDH